MVRYQSPSLTQLLDLYEMVKWVLNFEADYSLMVPFSIISNNLHFEHTEFSLYFVDFSLMLDTALTYYYLPSQLAFPHAQ